MNHVQPMEGATTANRIHPSFPAALEDRSSSTGDSQIDRLSKMPLSEFAVAGMVVRVSSKSLGRTVLFASDNADLESADVKAEGMDVFRAAELIALLELPSSAVPPGR